MLNKNDVQESSESSEESSEEPIYDENKSSDKESVKNFCEIDSSNVIESRTRNGRNFKISRTNWNEINSCLRQEEVQKGTEATNMQH